MCLVEKEKKNNSVCTIHGHRYHRDLGAGRVAVARVYDRGCNIRRQRVDRYHRSRDATVTIRPIGPC